MWRCAGCGAEVSEWAARCPSCRRPADDAIAIAPAPSAPDIPVPAAPAGAADAPAAGAPASDPPPAGAPAAGAPGSVAPAGRRRRRRRPAVAGLAGVAVLAAAIGWGVAARAAPRLPAPAARAFAGRIVSEDQTGRLSIADPDGARAVRHPEARGASGQIATLAVPPDGSYVLNPAGGTLALRGGRPEVTPATIAAADLSSELAEPDPFADHDGAVVVITAKAGFLLPRASIVAVATGFASPLGTVDSVAGDPQSPAAFASLPADDPATQPARLAQVHDTAVALLRAGQPPAILATAAALNRAVGQPPATAIIPALFPDPAGDRIAVVLDPVSADAVTAPVVVIDRHGGLVFAGYPPVLVNAQVSWSADGRVVAYPTAQGMLVGVSPGPSISMVPTSSVPTQWGGCVVAPTDRAVLCLVELHSTPRWVFFDLASEGSVEVPSRGAPLVWLAR